MADTIIQMRDGAAVGRSGVHPRSVFGSAGRRGAPRVSAPDTRAAAMTRDLAWRSWALAFTAFLAASGSALWLARTALRAPGLEVLILLLLYLQLRVHVPAAADGVDRAVGGARDGGAVGRARGDGRHLHREPARLPHHERPLARGPPSAGARERVARPRRRMVPPGALHLARAGGVRAAARRRGALLPSPPATPAPPTSSRPTRVGSPVTCCSPCWARARPSNLAIFAIALAIVVVGAAKAALDHRRARRARARRADDAGA